jgi:virginiamycin B lyase
MRHTKTTRRARIGVETMEGRQLLSLGFQEFPLATPAANQFVQVHDIALESSGKIAFASTVYGPPAMGSQYPTYLGTGIAEVASSGAITPLNPSGDATRSAIFGLVPGPDGNLWGIAGASPARLNSDGSITIFPIAQNSFAQAIAPGKDGALWFTEPIHATPSGGSGQAIGRVTTGGQITEYPLPANAALPDQIVAGSDNAMWFTMNDFGQGAAAPMIGRINTLGVVTEFSLPNAATRPHSIALGPDGNLWFTAQGVSAGETPTQNTGSNFIGKITPSGQVTEYPLPPQVDAQSQAYVLGGITAGPDGAVWFTEPQSGHLGRINTASGSVAEYAVPTINSAPNDLALGNDGALWFTEQLGDQVGRFQPGPDLSVSLTGANAVAGSATPIAAATFTDNTPGATGLYSAAIDWGDGTVTQGAIQRSGSRYVVLGGHSYTNPGTYALKVTVGEATGETDTTSGTLVARSGQAQSAHLVSAKRGPSQIVLAYDSLIDPTTASTATRYLLQIAGRKGVFGAKGSRSIKIKFAAYDPNTRTVTLTLRSTPPKTGAMRVAISGEGNVAVGR